MATATLDAILGKMDRRSGYDRLCDWVRADAAETTERPDPVQLLREDPCRVFEPINVVPDPWQRDVLTCDQQAVMLLCSRQSGKALDIDTSLLTTKGWTCMGAVEVGDYVYDELGNPTMVTWCSDIQYNESYEVSFSDGTSIVADADHLWTVLDKKTRTCMARDHDCVTDDWASWQSRGDVRGYKHGARTVKTSDMLSDLKLAKNECNYAVPTCKPVFAQEADLPIDPYVMGAWLGDGNSNSARLTTMDDQIMEEVEKAGYSLGKRADKSGTVAYSKAIGVKDPLVCRRGHQLAYKRQRCRGCEEFRLNTGWKHCDKPDGTLTAKLRTLGVLNNKHVPEMYLRASINQRIALLQGMMDTDGYIDRKKNQCEFTGMTHAVVLGFLQLVRGLGLMASIKEGRAKIGGVDHGPKWRVFFVPSGFIPFRLKRKADCVNLAYGKQMMRRLRYIRDIKPVGKRLVRCIGVEGKNKLYLAGDALIPTHNSFLMSACAIVEAITYPYAEVVVLSRTLRQSVELLRKVKELWRGLTGGRVNRRRNYLPVSTKTEVTTLEADAKFVGWEQALLMTEEFTGKVSNKALSMDFPNGSRITSLPCNPDGIVGFSAITLLILDEAARVSEAAFNVASPFLAATESQHGRPGRKIVASTPYGKRGWFWESWDRTERQKEAHARGVCDGRAGLTTCPWSERDAERRLERQAWTDGREGRPLVTQWYTVRVTADQCPRISEQFLADEREQLGVRWYNQEYNCEFCDLVDSVFSHEDVHSLADSSYEPAKAWWE